MWGSAQPAGLADHGGISGLAGLAVCLVGPGVGACLWKAYTHPDKSWDQCAQSTLGTPGRGSYRQEGYSWKGVSELCGG